ncbi:MAG: Rieske (2Fe-2S) protein [Chitinophagales bacterium]|nr:Rieske (2Fe-2S) protein [Bacteroidota bacterium]
MIEWHELEEATKIGLENLQLFQLARFQLDDRIICITRLEEGLFGIQNTCPHAGAQLHHGHCNRRGIITCPLHGYKFDIKTGLSADGNNYKIINYQFKIENEKLFIGWRK